MLPSGISGIFCDGYRRHGRFEEGVFSLIALACDHGGFELIQEVKKHLEAGGFTYRDFGTDSPESCDYPEIAARAARAVSGGECSKGILICGTGAGMAIAANKIPGIRAAACYDTFTAEMIRLHNDANVLAIGARVTGAGLALKIVDQFLNTDFEGGRHGRRVEMINELDKL
jgi:ribose 5-phosphate isomerase B